MNQEDLEIQAEQLRQYLIKENNKGIRFWLDSKDFEIEEILAIILISGDNIEIYVG